MREIFNGVVHDFVNHNVRQSLSGHAAAGSPKAGEILQAGTTLVDGLCNAAGSFRIVAPDALADLLEVFGRGQRPTDHHYVWRNR